MKKISKYIYFLFSFLTPFYVFADDTPPRLSQGWELASLVNKIFDYIYPVAGFLSLIFIIWGGYMWMMSGGDPGKVKQAQGTLTWAILGLIFVFVIVNILGLIVDFVGN